MLEFRSFGNMRYLVAGRDIRSEWWPFALCKSGADAEYIAAFYGQRVTVFVLQNS